MRAWVADVPELALGTVQFGLAYGIAGSSLPVDRTEIARILDMAVDAGIERIDTAPAYGEAEERLRGYIGRRPFQVVSKIVGRSTGAESGDAAIARVRESIARSRSRLGDSLVGLIFHDAACARNLDLRAAAEEASHSLGIACGVSGYDPAETLSIAAEWPSCRMVQVPGNALDQRVTAMAGSGLEISIRSALLQGLLAMPADIAAARVPAAASALAAWHEWCRGAAMTPLVAALSVVKGFPADYCVVGVETAGQLSEILSAWDEARALQAPELAQTTVAVIDPRLWAAA